MAGFASLMRKYLDGDPRSFRLLYDKLRPRLMALAVHMVGDEAAAADLVQTGLLRAHSARHRFVFPRTGADAVVVGWHLAIVRNAARDYLRGEQTHAALDERMHPEAEAELRQRQPRDAEVSMLRDERAEQLRRSVEAALSKLPPASRPVIEGRLRGESMEDISRRLGIGCGAVRVRAHRAYRALAPLLAAFRDAAGTYALLPA